MSIMTQKKQIFVWSGENDWAIVKEKQKWINVFEKKFGDFNIIKMDFENVRSVKETEQELKNAMQVDSLFGRQKLIILKNVFIKKIDNNFENVILRSFENIPENFFIVFCQKEKIDKRNKIYKKIQSLEKQGRVEIKDFAMPKSWELNNWIKNQVIKHNSGISSAAVSQLIVLAGNDLWQLEAEIQKLTNYCRGREISESDVNELVKGKFNNDIFQFVDAISARNKSRSAKLLSDQLSSGANQFYLLSMIVRQFRNIIMVKNLKNSGQAKSPEFAAQQLGLHAFVAKKSWAQADKFQKNELDLIYQRLLAIDRKFKSTSWSPQLLFDLFVIGL